MPFVFSQVLWPTRTQQTWFTVINRLAIGQWPLEKDISQDKSFHCQSYGLLCLRCTRAVLLEQFAPEFEASETHTDTQNSVRTSNSGGWWGPEQGIETSDCDCSQVWFIHVIYLSSIFLQFRLFIGALITKTLQQCLLSALLTDDFIVHYTYVQLSGKVLFFHLSVNETGILQTTAGFQTRQWLQGKSWSLPAKREQTL